MECSIAHTYQEKPLILNKCCFEKNERSYPREQNSVCLFHRVRYLDFLPFTGQLTANGRSLQQGRKGRRRRVDISELKYDNRGLIPAVVQQYDTGEVLMVAWMNAESLRLTLETGTTWFWSRSRQELWNKGATSGNMQRVKSVMADCDADTLLVQVDSPGPACHTGNRTCFFNAVSQDRNDGEQKDS